MGFANGIFGVLGPMYASSVIPVILRGYLTNVNIAFIIGQLISQGVLEGHINPLFGLSEFRLRSSIFGH